MVTDLVRRLTGGDFGGPIRKPTPRRREPKRLQTRSHPVPDWAREATFDRDERLCQWCRTPGGRLHPHHRLLRSQGGKDRPECLVTVHDLCHDYIHAHPAESRARRFIVRSEAELAEGWT